VGIVVQVYAAWEEDVARMTRDDDLWAAFVERVDTPHLPVRATDGGLEVPDTYGQRLYKCVELNSGSKDLSTLAAGARAEVR
jgi:hypothetical protein